MTTARIPDDVVYRPQGAGVLAMSLRSGQFATLNETAGRIWMWIAEGRSIVDMEASLVARYDASRETCRTELDALLRRLQSQQLIEVSADDRT